MPAQRPKETLMIEFQPYTIILGKGFGDVSPQRCWQWRQPGQDITSRCRLREAINQNPCRLVSPIQDQEPAFVLGIAIFQIKKLFYIEYGNQVSTEIDQSNQPRWRIGQRINRRLFYNFADCILTDQ